jgi:hypothetical protein
LITLSPSKNLRGLGMQQRWFFSYNSQDLALMQGVEASLRRKDSGAKVFFAATSA